MKLKIDIELNNDAMKGVNNGPAVKQVLKEVIEKIQHGTEPGQGGKLYDSNGNPTGTWRVTKR